MDTQGFVVGPLSAFCILVLVIGTAGAAVMTADGTSSPDTGPVHRHLSPEEMANSLGGRGADVSEVKAEMQTGDTTAVNAWLDTYVHAHEGEMPLGHHPGETRS
jgi:hypothetical protein